MEELKTIEDFPWSSLVKNDMKRAAVKWYFKLTDEGARAFILHFFKITTEDITRYK